MSHLQEKAKVKQLIKDLTNRASDNFPNWFKQGTNQYAEHDRFLGIRVPEIRQIIKPYEDLSLGSIEQLLQSIFNEIRQAALFILVRQYQTVTIDTSKKKIFNFYKKNFKYINNWNLVDSSAHLIVGAYLFDKEKTILYQWAEDKNLWKRRIAIVATWYFIRQGSVQDTLHIARLLFKDGEDLLHKATGWMLREVGKRYPSKLEEFLKQYHLSMPRVMVRYAIEHFPESKRKKYLLKAI